MLDQVITGEIQEFDEKIYQVEKEILQVDRPQTWNVYDDDNMERTMEVDFQKFAVQVQELTGMEIKETTVFTFYAAVEHLKEKQKKQK